MNQPKRVPLVSTWDFIRMVLVLGGVVAVIYLLFFLLKKSAKKRFSDNEFIEIIGSKDLSGGKALHLVKVGESIFLIGSADNSINLVSQITEKESLDSLKLDISQKTQGNRKSFQNALSDIFRKRTDTDPLVNSAHFIKKQRERLHKLK
ncbi:MAG: flagellar biosynthetic protein FliO [Spirochaetes bacterium]|nr:flagellar biosynthetic protein FliO [Spirochaetota bacterium]